MYNDKGNTKYLKLLKQNYSSSQDVIREIVNLSAIINLPKGTEFFLSDIHGEYEAFLHIMNNCSGVIKEKVDLIFKDTISDYDRQELCTLIYYPREKMALLDEQGKIDSDWYAMTLNQLILVAKLLSSKYTRSKVRKALPEEYAYIIDELLHAQEDEDANQVRYHKQILKTIIDLEDADEFIIALSALIKRLAVDHLHIVGDVFDRGGSADKILDLLYDYHSLDIEWGNHDILWMGAACGNDACICNVIRNNLKYNNVEILENAYGISLRQLMLFGMKTYGIEDGIEAARAAITVMLFKLEGQLILAHPEYEMGNRLMLDRLDELQDVGVDRKRFPTVDDERPYALSDEETVIMRKLHRQFVTGQRLHKHVRFLYDKGGMYNVYNGNLLYHGCVPMDEDGNFEQINVYGKLCSGKKLYEVLETYARKGYYSQDKEERRKGRDTLWYIWAGPKSPVFGKDKMATFERYFIADKETHKETKNAYYRLYDNEEILNKILREFGLDEHRSHIINGHVPVEIKRGETPIKCNGKLLIIDGGFSKAYQGKTGIAGYTLVANSHGMNLVEHRPFVSAEDAIRNETDMVSDNILIETAKRRILVADTDIGRELKESIGHLEKLLNAYRDGILIEKGI